MAWNSKYWDIVDQIFWSPKYIGLQSVPKKQWVVDDEHVTLPRSLVNLASSLYTRSRRATDNVSYLHGQEEILNHIFNLTFAIAPDAILKELLLKHLDYEDGTSFSSVGREIYETCGWGEHENVAQPDGFFVSERTAFAIELKLKSKSSPAQVAKYAALLALQEMSCERELQLGLLYIVPETALTDHWKNCGMAGDYVDATYLSRLDGVKLPSRLITLFRNHRSQIESVLRRMKFSVISWSALYADVNTAMSSLDTSLPGDQTIHRLLSGLKSQLDVHQKTEIIKS